MVLVGKPGEEFYINKTLKENLDRTKKSVLKKNFDYISVIAGYPGVGKSTLAQQVCKYLDPTFNTKERICFTGLGPDGIIERTAKAKQGQAFMLDESFADLNSKVGLSPEFVKIINHLQLIRQKNLFIILCLPNFFDLNKSIAVYRTRHLFVVYSDENFNRGSFGAFDREQKKKLYVLGHKFMNYGAAKANFIGNFTKKWVVDLELYEQLKRKHLIDQFKSEKTTFHKRIINKMIYGLYLKNWKTKEIEELSGYGIRNIQKIILQEKLK